MNREDTMSILNSLNSSSVETIKNNEPISNNEIKEKSYWSLLSEKLVSISLHVFIMVFFEIYFYFQFIIKIEKKMFMDKILNYTKQLLKLYENNVQPEYNMVIMNLFPRDKTNILLKILYEQYKNELEKQQELLNDLLIKSYKMLAIVSSILFIFVVNGYYNYNNKIKWKWIVFENMMMFLCLGIFEYLFLIFVILKYSPITDAEIEYVVAKKLLYPLMSNSTQI
jgi:hypothetical protein